MADRLRAVMNDPAAVVALLAETPAVATEKDKDGRNPLYHGFPSHAPAESILALLQQHPAAAREKDSNGHYPLRYGMMYNAPAEVILAVLQEHPAAAAEKDDDEWWCPLHLGMEYKMPAEVILAMLQAHPAAAAEKDEDGRYPLYYGMQNNSAGAFAPVEAILAVLQAHPAAAAAKDILRRCPLHLGMENKAPAEVILAVLQQHPSAASEKDGWAQYPLHIGMKNNAPAEGILAVLQANPAAAAEKDGDGRYPLYYGMKKNAPAEVLLAVLQQHPAAAAEKDDSDGYDGSCGWYPLHHVMNNDTKCPARAILALLQAHPAAAAEKDDYGRYPLHVGMENNAPAEAILAVLQAHPAAAAEKDDDGRYPLHHGMENKAPAEAILAVLQQHPAAAGEKSRSKSDADDREDRSDPYFYPLHLGMQNNAPVEAILAVLQAHPAAAGEKSHSTSDADDCEDPYFYPLHLGMQNNAPVKAILAVLQQHPAAASEKDGWAQYPLHIGMQNNAPAEGIFAVLQANPAAAGETGIDGRYPLYHGIIKKAPAEAILAVLQQHSAAAGEKDGAGRSSLYYAVHKPGSGGAVDPGLLRSLIAAQNTEVAFDTGDLAALFKPADLAPDAKIGDSGDDGESARFAAVNEHFAQLRAVLAAPVSWAAKAAERLAPGELCAGWTALMVAIDLEADAAFIWLLGRHASDPSFVHGDPELLGRKAVASAKASHTKSIEAWGRSYGHFLGRYVLDGAPKHVSPTCCVIFAKDLQAAESFVVIIAGSPDTTKATFATTEALFRDKTWIHDAATLKEFQTAVKAGTAFHNLKISSVKPEQVVLKFMHDPAAFQRELDCRKNGLEDSEAVISVICSHQSDEITAESLKDFKQVHLSTENPDQDTALDLLLVLERGSTDLSDVISHGDFAGKNMLRVRTIAYSIATCLQKMHILGVIHGDVKNRNFVMLPGGEYAAIDLDAAASIGELAGQKPTSSGCLPPEQAVVVLHRRQRVAAIFKHLLAVAGGEENELAEQTLKARLYKDAGMADADLPKFSSLDEDENARVSAREFLAFAADLKYEAMLTKYFDDNEVGGAVSSDDAKTKQRLEAERDRAFANRDFKKVTGITAEIDALAATRNGATPKAVIASTAYDMWCFGVLLYELATGITLFKIDVREEAVNDAELAKIAEWSDADKDEKLAHVDDEAMRALLGLLLHKDATKRPGWTDVMAVLNRMSANPTSAGNDEVLAKIAELGQTLGQAILVNRKSVVDLSDQLADATKTLSSEINAQGSATRNFMLELTAVTVPYLFDILDEKEFKEAEEDAAATFAEAAAATEVDGQTPKEFDLEGTAKGAIAAVAAIEKRIKWCKGLRAKAQSFLRKSQEVVSDTMKSPAERATAFIKANSSKTVYLRLLCGVTLETVVVYPIPVQENDAKVAEYLEKSARMMGIGLKVAATWNCFAGTARLFGLPVPKVSDDMQERVAQAKAFVEELQTTSDADVDARRETEAVGMTRGELGDFAKYLETLEAKGDDQPRWKDTLFAIQDPSALGRVTYTTDERAGIYGGEDQKAAIEAHKTSAVPPVNSGGAGVDATIAQNDSTRDAVVTTSLPAHRATNVAATTTDATACAAPPVSSPSSDALLSEMHEMRKMIKEQAALPVSSPSSDALLSEMREIRKMIEAQAKPQSPPSGCFWTSGRKRSVSANAASIKETDMLSATEAKMSQKKTETRLTKQLASKEQVVQNSQLVTEQHEQIVKLQETVNKLLAGQWEMHRPARGRIDAVSQI